MMNKISTIMIVLVSAIFLVWGIGIITNILVSTIPANAVQPLAIFIGIPIAIIVILLSLGKLLAR